MRRFYKDVRKSHRRFAYLFLVLLFFAVFCYYYVPSGATAESIHVVTSHVQVSLGMGELPFYAYLAPKGKVIGYVDSVPNEACSLYGFFYDKENNSVFLSIFSAPVWVSLEVNPVGRTFSISGKPSVSGMHMVVLQAVEAPLLGGRWGTSRFPGGFQ